MDKAKVEMISEWPVRDVLRDSDTDRSRKMLETNINPTTGHNKHLPEDKTVAESRRFTKDGVSERHNSTQKRNADIKCDLVSCSSELHSKMPRTDLSFSCCNSVQGSESLPNGGNDCIYPRESHNKNLMETVSRITNLSDQRCFKAIAKADDFCDSPSRKELRNRQIFERKLGHRDKDEGPSDRLLFKTTEQEVMVMPRIGRWWRQEGHCLINRNNLPRTTNPNTLLFHVARQPEGKSFLKGEKNRLMKQIDGGDSRASTQAALGSIEDWLGNTDSALWALQSALETDRENKSWQWLLEKLKRQQRVKQKQSKLLQKVPLQLVFPSSDQVPRVSSKDLSFAEFFHKYAMPRKPVIITDMVKSMTSVPWNLEYVRSIAGENTATVKKTVKGSVEWAGLEESRSVKISQFLDNLDNCQDYLFDWSLPLHCPKLAQELIIPRYFAGDFLQRTSPGSLYQDSWPSLFVAPPGAQSGLHIDAFASNFWMALFQGRKRWLFFEQKDTPCLYPTYAHCLDPTFEANPISPDLSTHPLMSLVHPKECTLHAGEILFVPGGSPHCVQNLETTLAISGNFVDLSNFTEVLKELEINSLLDPRADDLLKQFRRPGFVPSMKSSMGDLPWTEFKTWPPKDGLGDFDINCELS